MNLAIKGHKTKGRKVIQTLKMLGGRNINSLKGNDTSTYYMIADNMNIETCSGKKVAKFTLEEFFKEFPFKVGDKVICKHPDGDGELITEITSMMWSGNKVLYREDENDVLCFSVEELQIYNESIIIK